MGDDLKSSRLANDPSREAVDSMRGYSYQILRSIEAWIDLADGEILVLEGAEDLDRISGAAARVEQVKDTAGSGNVTLRSSNAIAALGNFWQHRKRNPDSTLQFRYLTTSVVGQERAKIEGLKSPGIEAWEAIRRLPEAATSRETAKVIQDYLATCNGLPQSLRDFLAAAPVETFVADIVLPFAWISGQPNATELQSRIEGRLIEFGEKRSIGAAAAVSALAKLHLVAWSNATCHDRVPLRRGDFIRIVEEASTTTVPNTVLIDLLKQVAGRTAGPASVTHVDPAITRPPRQPNRYFARPALEEAVAKALRIGTVHIHGSTGMGKTILAAAAVSNIASVGWIDLRDLDRKTVDARLRALIGMIDASSASDTIILDDLDPGDDPRTLLPALQHLVSSLKARGGSLLITSAHRVAPRLASVIDLREEAIFQAPSFTVADILVYFTQAGCSVEDADNWSKIVHASTSGHPQLVDARLAALQQQGWPIPNVTEWMLPPAEMVDVRAEARRMVSMLPQDQREMLYRASLVMGRISRKRLIAIGGIAPAVTEPGHTIDRLTGPWLEVTDTSDLRASPLLRGLGAETFGISWCEDMHAGIAWAWLKDPSLAAGDVATLLMHAVLSKRVGPLLHILPGLLEAPKEVWQEIGDTAGIFAMLGVDEGYETPFSSPLDRVVFRILQLRIAVEGQKGEIFPIIKRAFQEAEERDDGDVATAFFEFQFLWQVMRLDVVTGDIAFAIEIGQRLRRAAEEVGEHVALLEGGKDLLEIFSDLAPVFALTLLPSLSGADTFAALLDIAETLDQDDRRFVLGGRSGQRDAASMMLDTVWLAENQRSAPDWTGFVGQLKRSLSIAIASDLFALADTTAARLVRILDQDLQDPAAALLAADAALDEIDQPVRLLAAKAKVLYRMMENERALEIYQQILPASAISPSYRADILRDAAIAAAQGKAWSLAAARFNEGATTLGEQDPIERHVGFCTDHALASYLAGDTSAALGAFTTAIDLILKDGRDLPPEPLRSVRQYVLAAMRRVYLSLEDSTGNSRLAVEDIVGRASATETIVWESDRPVSLILLARQLLDLQLVAPSPDFSVIDALAALVRQSHDVMTLGTNWETSTRLAVVTGNHSEAVKDCVRETSYFAHLQALQDRGEETIGELADDPPPVELTDAAAFLFVARIIAVIIGLLAKDNLQSMSLETWRSDVPSDASYDRIRRFLSEVEDHLFGAHDPISQLFADQPTWEARILVALGALARQQNTDDLLSAQAVLAGGLDRAPPLAPIVALPLSVIVTRTWARLCEVPTFLSAPRLSVPAIQAAITSTPSGWRRTKAVLNAALLGVSSRTAQHVRIFIADLRDR